MEVLIGKTGQTVSVDFDSLPDNAKAYIVHYGFKQALNDAHSAFTIGKGDCTAEMIMEIVGEKLQAIVSGELNVRSGGRIGDPVRAEAIGEAEKIVKNAVRKAGKKLADVKNIRELAEKYLASHPELTEKAKKTVEARNAETVDLTALGM